MSRRSRKRRGIPSGGWLGRAAIGSLVLAVLCAAVGYWSLKHYLHSDGFRKLLSAKVSQAVGMEGEFSPFRWDGLAVDTGSFEAKGTGVIASLYADRLHTEVNLSGVRRGVWDLDGATVSHVEINFDARTRPSAAMPPGKAHPSSFWDAPQRPAESGWLPQEVEINSLDLRDVSARGMVDDGEIRASGMQIHLDRASDPRAYRGNVLGGTIRLPFELLPTATLERVRFRYRHGEVFVTEASARVFKDGRFEGDGEWNLKDPSYAFEGNLSGVKCDEFLSEDWAKRLTGDASSTVTLQNTSDGLLAKGTLTIKNGVLTALPVLDALAAYADTRRFRVLSLTEAKTDWRWQSDTLTFSNLVLSCEGLVRLEGSISIRKRAIDGQFRLGLAPGTLASIPGAETVVFLPGERGLRWSPLHLTGTLDDVHEDLTERLTAAAESRMFEIIPETGEKVLKFTNSLLGGSGQPLKTGVEVLNQATGTVGQAADTLLGGVLGGLLGVPTAPVVVPPPPPEPPPTPPEKTPPAPPPE